MAEPSDATVHDSQFARIAAVYAKALLGATERAGQTESVMVEFDAMVASVLDRQPKFESVLASGMVPTDRLVEVLDKAFAGHASPLFLNFLKVVATHGRLAALRSIHHALQEQYNALRGRVIVNVSTATELDDAMASMITKTIRGALGIEPVLKRRLVPDLIAGVVVQIGDTVYDGSVATSFRRLKAEMLQRSVHEIQRDQKRFQAESEAT